MLEWLTWRNGAIIVSGIAVAILLAWMKVASPNEKIDVVDFQRAGSREAVNCLLSAWGSEAPAYLDWNLKVDFALIAAYTLYFGLICWAIGDFHRDHPGMVYLSWGMVAATVLMALADVVEDYALFQVLATTTGDGWPALAYHAATIKFVLLFLALTPYVVLAGGYSLYVHFLLASLK